MLVLTKEIMEKLENDYNYFHEMYAKQEDKADQNYYLGKCSAISDVLSYFGYTTKMKYCVVKKEEE